MIANLYFYVMIRREAETRLRYLLKLFPVITLNGPRQSGKTTLVKSVLKKMPYVSLENPDDLEHSLLDPRGFLARFPKGGIIDETQRSPKLFSYIQGIVDDNPSRKFVLTGSQNFLLMQSITQSLAGRVAILKLLPFSVSELDRADQLPETATEAAWKGFYPPLYDRKIPPGEFYSNYLNTYVERDLREILKVANLQLFIRFLKMCAGRVGQLLNLSDIAAATGVSVNTAKGWISILETSFIVFLLPPYHRNFTRRLTKMPKLYFHDTGFLCHLLGISDPSQASQHFAGSGIFENLVIADVMKRICHAGQIPDLYFWRDHKGKEIDLVIESGGKAIPVEIKSALTRNMSFFDGLDYWRKLSGDTAEESYVVYGGTGKIKTTRGNFIGWQEFFKRKWV